MADLIKDIVQIYSKLYNLNETSVIDEIVAKNLLEELCRLMQQLLEEDQNIDEKVLEVLYQILQFSLQLLILPQNDSIEDIETNSVNYVDYIERTEYVLPVIVQICKLILNDDKIKFPLQHVKNIVVLGLNVCGCHSEIYAWNNSQIVLLTSELLNELLFFCKCTSLRQLMEGGNNCKFEDGLSRNFFSFLLSKLKSTNWKKNSSSKFIFRWGLHSVKHPNLFHILPEVLSPSLLFIDDFVSENRILGIQCLHYIIQNVNPTELRMYGRADVIFDALFQSVYANEAELIDVAYPCLLDILPIIDLNPTKPDQSIKRNKHDKVFNHLLTSMEFEQKLALRKSYIVQLEPYITKMGIRVVRHMKTVLRIIFDYLEVYGEASSKRNTLLALKSLIKTAWPRIPSYMKEILRNLLKFAYEIQTEETSNSGELLSLVTECLVLLRKTSHEDFETLCTPLYNIEVEPIKSILQTIS